MNFLLETNLEQKKSDYMKPKLSPIVTADVILVELNTTKKTFTGSFDSIEDLKVIEDQIKI